VSRSSCSLDVGPVLERDTDAFDFEYESLHARQRKQDIICARSARSQSGCCYCTSLASSCRASMRGKQGCAARIFAELELGSCQRYEAAIMSSAEAVVVFTERPGFRHARHAAVTAEAAQLKATPANFFRGGGLFVLAMIRCVPAAATGSLR
jgi:hypothetical protein